MCTVCPDHSTLLCSFPWCNIAVRWLLCFYKFATISCGLTLFILTNRSKNIKSSLCLLRALMTSHDSSSDNNKKVFWGGVGSLSKIPFTQMIRRYVLPRPQNKSRLNPHIPSPYVWERDIEGSVTSWEIFDSSLKYLNRLYSQHCT